MKKKFGFNEQLKVGDLGEAHFKERYKFQSPIKSNEYEVDFTLKNGKTIELKTDSYPMDKTPNFFMETIGDTSNGKLGGVFRAKQDKIDLFVYYFLTNRTFFWFKVNELYDRVEKLISTNEYEPKSIPNRGWETEGFALPRSEFSDIIILEDKW
jgi:hypothetical protein